MALTDHNAVFIGSTDDGHTFVLVNRKIPAAHQTLVRAGFTTREHHGRTVYYLAPDTSEDAVERALTAAYSLMAHTMDLVDLAWTTRARASGQQPVPALSFCFNNGTVTATATTGPARAVLKQHRFTRTTGDTYAPPAGLGERDLVATVVRAETHGYADGLDVRVDLGIPTLAAIPAASRTRRPAAPSGPARPPLAPASGTPRR
ncbi:hypothetical protein AB0J38_24900 [Streptomyces sp. NPDC050095]|uniref:hypothetical protein n=1 Tax=unclassified Streptomyces TaxID=2593676 RepID=UPI00341D548B